MIIDTPWMPRLVPTADLGGAVAASTAEVTAGTDNTKFITPAALEGADPAFSAGTVPAQIARTVNSRAPAQGLVFDGTAGATVANVPAFGTGDFTVAAFGSLPSTLSAAIVAIAGATNSANFHVNSNGAIQIGKEGVANLTESTSVATLGKSVAIAYTRSGTTGTYYINGVAAGSVTDANDYSVAVTKIGSTTTNFWQGRITPYVENRALTAAEVLALYESGAPAAGDFGASGAPASTVVTAGSFVVGKRYRIASAGTTDFTLIGAANSTVGTEFTATGVGTGTGTATAIGLLLAPEAAAPGNGYQWKDMSGNKADILLPTTGVSWALPDTRLNSFRATCTWAGGSHEPKSVRSSGTAALPPDAAVTSVWVKASAGSSGSGISICDGNAVPQFAAAQSYTTAKKSLTVANSGIPLGTAELDRGITVDPDTSNYTGSINVEVFYQISVV